MRIIKIGDAHCLFHSCIMNLSNLVNEFADLLGELGEVVAYLGKTGLSLAELNLNSVEILDDLDGLLHIAWNLREEVALGVAVFEESEYLPELSAPFHHLADGTALEEFLFPAAV